MKFTGAAAAIACLARLDQPFRLVVVEPSGSLGRGLAYGAHHPLHLLNVRTRDLSVRAGQPGDFLNWAFRQLDQGENHAGLHDGLAHTFLPRQLFGEYVRQRFFETVEARGDVELKLINAVATSCIENRDHDAETWRQFVAVYAAVVYGFARKRGLQDADAADLVSARLVLAGPLATRCEGLDMATEIALKYTFGISEYVAHLSLSEWGDRWLLPEHTIRISLLCRFWSPALRLTLHSILADG